MRFSGTLDPHFRFLDEFDTIQTGIPWCRTVSEEVKNNHWFCAPVPDVRLCARR
jgi:hypothetical protein